MTDLGSVVVELALGDFVPFSAAAVFSVDFLLPFGDGEADLAVVATFGSLVSVAGAECGVSGSGWLPSPSDSDFAASDELSMDFDDCVVSAVDSCSYIIRVVFSIRLCFSY